MEATKFNYIEIAKANITENRNVIISTYDNRGYTIAQQMQVKEGDKITSMFMKGAFHINDISGLYNIRDAINIAIDKIENNKINTIEWDD